MRSFQQPVEVESLGRAVCASVWFYAQILILAKIRGVFKRMFTCGCNFFWAEVDNNDTLEGLTTESLSPMTGSLETS